MGRGVQTLWGFTWLAALLGAAGCTDDVVPTPYVGTPTQVPVQTAAPTPPPPEVLVTVFPTPHAPTSTPTPTPTPTPAPTDWPSLTPTPTLPPTPTPTAGEPTPAFDLDYDGVAPRDGDCDDGDPNVNPGEPERCNGIDDDCDGLTDAADPGAVDARWYFVDGDGDHFGGPTGGIFSCEPVAGRISNDFDCDDGDPAIHPDAPERCDAADVDEDCDGWADDGDPGDRVGTITWYPDTDLDGFGDEARPEGFCDPPPGAGSAWLLRGEDCDDTDDRANPGVAEACDARDTNCDGQVDEGFDLDGDGTSDCIDDDGDGFTEANLDCDDADPLFFPFAEGYSDLDLDGRADVCDNCPWVKNPAQADTDRDGRGDLCTPAEGGDWGPPTLVGELSTLGVVSHPFISPDGLTLYFTLAASMEALDSDLWVATRPDRSHPFEGARRLDGPVNTPAAESHPSLSADGLVLAFTRGDGTWEGSDLYLATRSSPASAFGTPTALAAVNTRGLGEANPFLSLDGLGLYFATGRDGQTEIYQSERMSRAHSFGAATLVPELSSEWGDRCFAVRADGLVGYLVSSRGDGTTSEIYEVAWSGDAAAFEVPALVSSLSDPAFDSGPTVTADGQELYFFSARTGVYEIFRSLRR